MVSLGFIHLPTWHIMSIKQDLRRFAGSIGFDILRFSPAAHPLARKKRMFEHRAYDIVLDIGANDGGFARQLRRDVCYSRKIYSFEPLSSAFAALQHSAKNDSDWEVFNFALGDAAAKQEINIAGNSFSSSLLDMMPAHEKTAPESKYIGKEVIEIKTLDSIFADLCKPDNRVYMKVDTQGFENRVLNGAVNSLEHIDTIEMELSLVPLYKEGLLFAEMVARMSSLGFVLVAVECAFVDPESGQMLQVDGIFRQTSTLIS
jgi:FkbM family methyltransferase